MTGPDRHNQFSSLSCTSLWYRQRGDARQKKKVIIIRKKEEKVEERRARGETKGHAIAYDEGMMDEGAASLRDRDMIASKRGGLFVHL